MPFLLHHSLRSFNRKQIEEYTGEDTLLNFCKDWFHKQPEFSFKTSGSTGPAKEIILNRNMLSWSAAASKKAFQLHREPHLLLCLNPEVIGGRMILVRAMEWDCEITVIEPASNPLKNIEENHGFTFLSLVPYQLEQVFKDPGSIDKLNRFELLLLGGAKIEAKLQEEIGKKLNIRCLHSYGMTETSSHIALREVHPNLENHFTALEGVRLSQGEDSRLSIESPSAIKSPLLTNDLVELFDGDKFILHGRADLVVNSGGIKISIEEIENLSAPIMESYGFPFVYWKKNDDSLGERLVLLVEGDEDDIEKDEILESLKQQLPRYKAPKEIIFVGSFQRSKSGKILREESLMNHGKK